MSEEKSPRITSAVLVEKDGKFLLGERNKDSAKGYWVIPGGGVKFGETIYDAAIREIKEETNLDVEIIKLIGYKEVIVTEHNYHRLIFFHLAKPKHTNIEAKDDISKAEFFSIEEIKKLKLIDSAQWALKEAGFWK
ncbi:MAG TPA: NUDIX domain-containing protein [Candidatus Nanoarchaeia archaeon]|nr:NUDIX domain-containing protein [Candidatus Nanoarchaeia archaeon]